MLDGISPDNGSLRDSNLDNQDENKSKLKSINKIIVLNLERMKER